MMGLADDGGLLVPDEFPQVKSKFHEWRALSFSELSLEIMLLFTSGRIPREEFAPLVQRSYTNFRHPKITPVKSVGKIHIFEVNSYVAIVNDKIDIAIKCLSAAKIKGKKFKVGKA